ncbi:hypothetical protein Pla52o_01530 [Novipirellula galeiformis]|uniref:YetF C-terminal domain-containing protein n=1 Tax=Novipirellula galeiformis TaxID=2528004 RepID=A0A5C6CP39_9BACT|nr:YetF domain-containing protein [Novipirellula galeiformis]TWU26300.1 hypothetical protein Pla52o_01530 [Novipirellula galeiformis]
MIEKWLAAEWSSIALVGLSSLVCYAAILLYTRIVGLRSFSKLSAADFAMTIAVGSLFASTISAPSPTLVLGIVAIGCLYAMQWGVAVARRQSKMFGKALDNQPLLLMRGPVFLDDNLKQANVTREDVYGKLRAANVFSYDQILAVVFETTGDISVIHSSDDAAKLDPDFFHDVIGAEHLSEPIR